MMKCTKTCAETSHSYELSKGVKMLLRFFSMMIVLLGLLSQETLTMKLLSTSEAEHGGHTKTKSVQKDDEKRTLPSGPKENPQNYTYFKDLFLYKLYNKIRNNHLRNQNCVCQNGGTCILGSFCDCPTAFTGRYCELKVETLECDTPVGTLKHADIYLDFHGDCRLCQCFNGNFTCEDWYTCDELRNIPLASDSAIRLKIHSSLLLLVAVILSSVLYST